MKIGKWTNVVITKAGELQENVSNTGSKHNTKGKKELRHET